VLSRDCGKMCSSDPIVELVTVGLFISASTPKLDEKMTGGGGI
jgi:hypothetical protein